MDSEFVLEALGGLDSALVEAAAERPPARRRNWAVIAALAAALCLLGAGMAQHFWTMSGVHLYEDGHLYWAGFRDAEAPCTVEDGRVFFTAGGQRIDITGQFDETTPYVWAAEYRDRPVWLIVGGEPENPGWAEVWVARGEMGMTVKTDRTAGTAGLPPEQLREELWREMLGDDHPWLTAALEELQGELEALLPLE